MLFFKFCVYGQEQKLQQVMGQSLSHALKTVCVERVTCFAPIQYQQEFFKVWFCDFCSFAENVRKGDENSRLGSAAKGAIPLLSSTLQGQSRVSVGFLVTLTCFTAIK